jgi:cell division protein FtsI (penicillin-binding protein 3)
LCLLALGAVMAYGSAIDDIGQLEPLFRFKRHIFFGLIGLGVMYALSRRTLDFVERLAVPLFALSLALLIAAHFFGIGSEYEGKVWVDVGGSFAFRPAELCELAFVLFAADVFATRSTRKLPGRDPYAVVPVMAAGYLLVLLEPTSGTILIVSFTLAALLIVAGARISALAWNLVGGLAALALFAIIDESLRERLLAFVDPWAHAGSTGFQTVQSLIAIGSGGLIGNGFGQSVQRAYYLPGADSEFVLAVIGEELGVVAIWAVLGLFMMIAYAGLRTATSTAERYPTFLAAGLTSLVVTQAVLNSFAVLGLSPPSSIELPLVSYGIGSLLLTCVALGLLISVMRRAPMAKRVTASVQGDPAVPWNVAVFVRRTGLLFAIFLILFAAAGTRSAWLGVVRAGSLRAEANRQQTRVRILPAPRGRILDRHGFPLAVSRPAYDVVAIPYQVDNPIFAARRLAPSLGVEENLLRFELARDASFVYLKRGVRLADSEVRGLRLPGIEFLPAMSREHPRERLAGQVIGGVGLEGFGLLGVEYAYERQLSGEDGRLQTVTNGLGQPMSREETEVMVPGRDLKLTLDAGLQEKVEEALVAVAANGRPRGAAALALDPRSGDVLAMASWPSLDPGDVSASSAVTQLNRGIGFQYQPGSVFDPLVVASALEGGVVEEEETIDVPGHLAIADRIIESEAAGSFTPAQIAERVSDPGTALLGLRLGATPTEEWLQRFGFGRWTGIELPGEHRGVLPSIVTDDVASIASISIGREQWVTPLQLAAAYATFAGDGVLVPPRIVKWISGEEIHRPAGKRVLSPETAEAVRRMLGGDGRITVAAPVADPDSGSYSATRSVVTAIGFTPGYRPRLVLLVVLDRALESSDPVALVGGALDRIERFAVPYLGIDPG